MLRPGTPRPHRVPVALTIAAMFLLLAGCASTGLNRGDANLVSLQEEWRMGRQLSGEVSRQVPLVRDRALNAYVGQMGRRLVRETELRHLPWTFHVVADPAVNAFAIPGGHVYVNTGLIAAARSEAELAGVIAHEIAHGTARHGTERLTKARGLSLGAGLVLGRRPSTLERIGAQLAGAGVMARFSRDDEREADALGVVYMHRAGYDPRGMARMFETLLDQRRRRPGAVQRFFSTHPLTEERIRRVRRYANVLAEGRRAPPTAGSFTSIRRRAARYR